VLFAMPQRAACPLSSANAWALRRPDADLLVSPSHRMLVKAPSHTRCLNTDEVFRSPPRDSVNGRSVTIDAHARESEPNHLLLDFHEVLWANASRPRAFTAASARAGSIRRADSCCAVLRGQFPNWSDPRRYLGGYAGAQPVDDGPKAAYPAHAA